MSFFQTAPCPESNYHSCMGLQGLQLDLITEPPLPAVSHVAHLDSLPGDLKLSEKWSL